MPRSEPGVPGRRKLVFFFLLLIFVLNLFSWLMDRPFHEPFTLCATPETTVAVMMSGLMSRLLYTAHIKALTISRLVSSHELLNNAC